MEETINTKGVGIRYGLLTSVASIILFLGIVFTGLSDSGQWAHYPIYVVLIILSHRYFKENNDDSFMSYRQGMSIAFWLSLIYSVIYSAFTYVYIKFIDAGFIETIKEKQIEKFHENGMSDQQIEQAMNITETFMKPEALFFFGIIGGVISILITALVVTIFTQEKNPD